MFFSGFNWLLPFHLEKLHFVASNASKVNAFKGVG